MFVAPDHFLLTRTNPCVLTLITEAPGALAVSELDLTDLDALPNRSVLALTLPRRGKRFATRTPVGWVVDHLRAKDRIARFTISLPDRFRTMAEFEDRLHDWPDLLHLLRRLDRMRVPARLTLKSVWRPTLDQLVSEGETYANRLAADLRDKLPDTSPAAEQCLDALLLNFINTCTVANEISPPVADPTRVRRH